MTLMYMVVVMLISSSIMLYCNEYMSVDSSKLRFLFWIFFLLSMMLMIISPNMISILIGWDGLGLISYLLVIYYNSYSSYNLGLLTVLMNRIGDVFILMSIGMMMMFGSMNFVNFSYLNNYYLLFIIIAAFTKSAQFPFSSWLPTAMAALTPVSALVHSSTLVTAEVYLLIRFNHIMNLNLYMMELIKILELITMFMAGISAILNYDLKKIVAFSTLSQLGLLMMIYGAIHSMNGVQDIRVMGGVKYMLPVTYMVFIVANFASCGMPFLTGFYSKDMILEFFLVSQISYLMKLMLLMSIGFVIYYE